MYRFVVGKPPKSHPSETKLQHGYIKATFLPTPSPCDTIDTNNGPGCYPVFQNTKLYGKKYVGAFLEKTKGG